MYMQPFTYHSLHPLTSSCEITPSQSQPLNSPLLHCRNMYTLFYVYNVHNPSLITLSTPSLHQPVLAHPTCTYCLHISSHPLTYHTSPHTATPPPNTSLVTVLFTSLYTLLPTPLHTIPTPPPHFMNRSSRCGTRYSRGTKVCSQAVMEGKQLTEKQMFTRLRTLESCLWERTCHVQLINRVEC